MEVSAQALAVLLFLLPGFVASRIVGAVAVRRAKGHLGEIVEALILSYLIYLALEAVGWGVLVPSPVAESTARVAFGRAAVSLVLAVVFALLYGASINHDWHMQLLRWMKVTVRTARTSTWLDVFTEQRGGIVVRYADGRRLAGWPAFYSDDPEEGLLYLRSPAWIDNAGNWHSVEGDGILIDVRDGIDSIEFLKGGTGDV